MLLLQKMLLLPGRRVQRRLRGDVVGGGRHVLGGKLLSQGALAPELPNSVELVAQSGNFLSLGVQLPGQDRVVVAQGGSLLSLGVELLHQECVLLDQECVVPEEGRSGGSNIDGCGYELPSLEDLVVPPQRRAGGANIDGCGGVVSHCHHSIKMVDTEKGGPTDGVAGAQGQGSMKAPIENIAEGDRFPRISDHF